MDRLNLLRDAVLAADQEASFLERETIRHAIYDEALRLPEEERYTFEFERILAGVSTPIHPADLILGRVVEGRWTGEGPWWSDLPGGIGSEGHVTFDYPALLTRGLDSLVAEARQAAEQDPTPNRRFFATQAERCAAAIGAYAKRYAAAARQAAETAETPEAAALMRRAAQALEVVPMRPAYDFFSALQSVWLLHLILSAYVGQRDFCFGRMDQYLLPWLENDDIDRAEAVTLLAHFLLKTNELAGTSTEDFHAKPVPCQASKQYVVIGGVDASGHSQYNVLSEMILAAADQVRLPQPTINLRVSAHLPDAVWQLAGEATAQLHAQLNFFNDDIIVPLLLAKGFAPEDAWNYQLTACNRVELPQKMYNIMCRIDKFDRNCDWFMETLNALPPETASVAAILQAYGEVALRHLLEYNAAVRDIYVTKPIFRFDSLAFPSCRATATDLWQGGAENYRMQHHMFNGIATIADSLQAIDTLVFREKRFTLPEFLAIVAADFAGHEPLRQEISHRLPKFGNNIAEVDQLAAQTVNTLFDALDEAGRRDGFIMIGSLYSLGHHHWFGHELGATPDGRRAGEPLSENQSPSYGADVAGPTAVLQSVARLPLERTVCGGLNLKLGCRPSAATLAELLRSAFGLGVIHLGFTIVDRATLEQARIRPEEFRTLCVRKYGFSEFFVALSPEFQKEIIERTAY